MEVNLKLRRDNVDPLPQTTCSKELVGSLIYLFIIRAGIPQVMHVLNAPTLTQYASLLPVLCYLHGTMTRSLIFFSLQILLLLFKLTQMLVEPVI